MLSLGVLCVFGGILLAVREESWFVGPDVGWLRFATVMTAVTLAAVAWGVAGCLNLLAEVHQRQTEDVLCERELREQCARETTT